MPSDPNYAAEAPPTPGPPDAPVLHALLAEIVDYAGQFPPADLDLATAVEHFARYRSSPEAWMLARFVHPVGRLDALDAHAGLFRHEPPFRFSVLGTGGDAPDAFLRAFADDLEAIARFHERHHDRVLADVMEVRLPAALLQDDAPPAPGFFEHVHRRLLASGLGRLDLFYEVPLAEEIVGRLPRLLAAMADHNSHQDLPLRAEAGLKIRLGGLEPAAFPSARHVAQALAAARDAGVRFKATAGLHHPLRHRDDEIGATMHGFLNVFAAAALAHAEGLDASTLAQVLEEEDARRFQFAPEALSWQGHAATLEDIEHAREAFAISFGSCSFEEPIDDLRAMGLL